MGGSISTHTHAGMHACTHTHIHIHTHCLLYEWIFHQSLHLHSYYLYGDSPCISERPNSKYTRKHPLWPRVLACDMTLHLSVLTTPACGRRSNCTGLKSSPSPDSTRYEHNIMDRGHHHHCQHMSSPLSTGGMRRMEKKKRKPVNI